MNSKTLTTIATYTLLAGTVISALSMPRTLLGGVEAAEPEEAPATDVALIVMYGVDADTNQLLRYTFMNDEYEPVADLVTDDGQGLVDVEALAYIPDGEFKGMYCSPVAGSLQGHLCKIEVLTGMVSPRPQRTCGDGLRGMVAYETQPGKWRLLAACETTKELWLIHPASGQVTVLATLDQRYDGLAVDGNGVLYGATVSSLYKIDLTTFTETKIGDHGFSKVEALEFAFGPGYSCFLD